MCTVLYLASVPTVGIYLLAASGPSLVFPNQALSSFYDVYDASSFLPLTWECPGQKHAFTWHADVL